jgi:hypothetical protein
MKLTWHIAKKDFRRLWPLLVLWWGVLVVRAFEPTLDFAARMSNVAPGALLNEFNSARPFVLLGADIFLLLLIGMAAIQTDSPIKPGAHWRTLPLAGGRALWAKLHFFVAFCGLPAALINLAAKVAYGFPTTMLFAGLAWLEWKIAACVAVGVMMASLFRRPLLTLLLVVIGYSFYSVQCNTTPVWLSDVGWRFGEPYTEFLTRFLILSSLLLALALGAVVGMYHYRRRFWSGVILVGGVVFTQTTQTLGLWPFDLFGSSVPAAQTEIPAYSLKFSPLRLTWRVVPPNRNIGYIAQFSADVTGLRSHHSGEAWILVEGHRILQLPDVPIINFYEFWTSNFPVNYAEDLQAFGLDAPRDDQNKLAAYSFGTPQENLKLLAAKWPELTPPALAGRLGFLTGQLTRMADAPVIRGARLARSPDGFAIKSIDVTSYVPTAPLRRPRSIPGDPIPLTVEITLLSQTLDAAGAPLHVLGSQWSSEYDYDSHARKYYFVLWNPKRHETVSGENFPQGLSRQDQDVLGENEGSGLTTLTDENKIYFEFYKPAGAGSWSKQEIQDWLADARLVGLRFTPEHNYVVPANIDRLELSTPEPEPAP